jgi:hypothetical protein
MEEEVKTADIPKNGFDEDVKKDNNPVPYRTLESILEFVSIIYNELGHDVYQTREQIAQVHGLSPNTIKQQLSTAQSFGLLEIKHRVGYKTTDLFARIHLPGDEEEKKQGILEAIKSFPLYGNLLAHYEKSGILPNYTGIANTISRQFGVQSTDVAAKAAKDFVSTLRTFGLLDDKNILRLNSRLTLPIENRAQQTQSQQPTNQQSNPSSENHLEDKNSVTVTVPLGDGTVAKIILPSKFTDKMLNRIIKFSKALLEADEEDRQEAQIKNAP